MNAHESLCSYVGHNLSEYPSLALNDTGNHGLSVCATAPLALALTSYVRLVHLDFARKGFCVFL